MFLKDENIHDAWIKFKSEYFFRLIKILPADTDLFLPVPGTDQGNL